MVGQFGSVGVVVFPIVWGRVRVCEAASRDFPNWRRGYPGGSVGPENGGEGWFAIEGFGCGEVIVWLDVFVLWGEVGACDH